MLEGILVRPSHQAFFDCTREELWLNPSSTLTLPRLPTTHLLVPVIFLPLLSLNPFLTKG